MLTALSKNAVYRILCKVLLFLVLVGLPLTSLPLLSRLSGYALVSPFSFIPLVILLIIWFIPYLLERGKFPAEAAPLFYFVLIAVAVSALAFFLDGYYARGRDFFDQSIRAFISLTIGLSFYLFFSVFPQNEKGFKQVLGFIYIGGVFLIGFSLLEFSFLRIYGSAGEMPVWFIKFRTSLAYQSPSVYTVNRIAGLAYEPSWFVRQFNLVLFPLWLSAVYQRKSLLKWRLWIFQVEDFLMLGGLVVFGVSSPRIGLLAFIASLAYIALMLISQLHGTITAWYLGRRKSPPKNSVGVKVLLAVLMVVLAFIAAAGALVGYVAVASQWDYRYQSYITGEAFAGLDLFPLSEDRVIRFSENLAFMERMIYWYGGWHVFNDYPFGVGLGNTGFFFADRVNGQAFKSIELRNLLFRAPYLSNTKNLWVRLLSETGFPGLVVFLVWLIVLWRSSTLMRKRGSATLKIVGLAGQLFLLAYLLEGFSMDSFAMPYQWLMTGLISAGGLWVRKQAAEEQVISDERASI